MTATSISACPKGPRITMVGRVWEFLLTGWTMAAWQATAGGLLVFGAVSLLASQAATVHHAPQSGPRYVIAVGAATPEPTLGPNVALSAPVLKLNGRAALSCQTVVTLGGLTLAHECVSPGGQARIAAAD